MNKGLNSLKNCQGFSLIEVMVTFLLITIVGGGIMVTFLAGEDMWQINQVQVDVQQNLLKAQSGMVNHLRGASSSSILNVPADDAWYTTITFKAPTGVTSGNLQWDAEDTVFALGGSGGEQIIKTRDGVSTIMALNIQSLQFRRSSVNPDILEVALVAQENTIKGIPVTNNMNFQVQLRN